MKKKLIFIGMVFLFIFSIQVMFQGDSNSILMNNPKLATNSNFEAISESEYATRWVLSNTSAFEDFHDDIASGYWDLYDVSNRYFNKYSDESDGYLFDNYSISEEWHYTETSYDVNPPTTYPVDILWDGTNWWVLGEDYERIYKYTSSWVYTDVSYWIGPQDTSAYGIFWDGTNFWMCGSYNNAIFKYYSNWTYTGNSYDINPEDNSPQDIFWDGTNWWLLGYQHLKVYKYNSTWGYLDTSYDVSTEETYPTGIYWDGTNWWLIGANSDNVYKYNSTWGYTGTSYDISTEETAPKDIFWDDTNWWMVGSNNDNVHKYNNLYNISKNYYGGGYAYMQTNTTETTGLISPTYGSTYNLSSGDYFKINCKPITSNKIELKLYNNSVLQKTITVVPQGNTNYNTRNIEVSVDEYVEFDQLLFTGTLEDTKYFKVFDIKTYKYEATGVSFWVAPDDKESRYIYPDSYILKIYQQDALKVEINITLTADLYTYIYSPIGIIECRLSLFSQENDPLDFSLFHTNITRTLNNNTDTYPLLSNIFITDVETNVRFEIWDRFDNLIKDKTVVSKSFIDITIDIYSLKIKNEYENYVPYTLKNNDTGVVKSGYIFSEEIIEYLIGTGTYIFSYTKNDDFYSVIINFIDNQILVINSSRLCFLSYANQRGEYLFFNNYKTYVNGSLIYENIIYREIGVNVSVEVKDRYDISIKNASFIVNSTDNYFSVILTEYSLKVCNQQEKFNHINITRDPNYYESGFSWSEWIAPNEIIDFLLFAGYYKINVTNVEDDSYSYYSYTLSGDDILLITSDNTITNTILSITNVNTTLGNQITNVEINITNQNSAINNTVVNIEINLDNVNSTIGDLLIAQGIHITNIENNLTSLYVFTNNSFINLNSSIGTYFVNIENNIISINQSISNLVIGVDNNIALINGTISTLIADLGNNLLIMNTTIDTSFFFLNTTIAEIGNNITTNTILLNNSIFLTGNWINDSRIAILNNLALINNTIMTGINQIYTSVYLINNSIYTAVIDLGTSLSLVNNTISGNISIILQQNDFLTAIYNKTMFSDLLNWSGVGYNFSIMEDRIDSFKFINEFNKQSVEIFLKYQNKIDSLILSAQNSLEQWLPKEDVEYRLKSVETGEYLSDWEEMPKNKTVDFGWYETEVPETPEPWKWTEGELRQFVFIIIGLVALAIVIVFFCIVFKKELNR